MSRLFVYALLLTAALSGVSCGDDEPDPGPIGPSPVEIVENLAGTLTINGAVTHTVRVERAGDITAVLTAVTAASGATPPGISIALGTWNGVSCAIVVANDRAVPATTTAAVIGRATVAGDFCLRVSDPGTLTEAVDYQVQLTHF